jgi:hypothetical protein
MLDVRSFSANVAFLMTCSKLLLAVANQENIFISRRSFDIVCQFLNIFISELIEKVNNESARNLINFNPRLFNFRALAVSDSFSLIRVVSIELLCLDDVEAEEIIFAGNLLTNLVFSGSFSQLFQEPLDLLLISIFTNNRNNNSPWILYIT